MTNPANTKTCGPGTKAPNGPVTPDMSYDELAMLENMAREHEDMLYGYQTLIEDSLHHFMTPCPA